ncbi:MAG: hypothetical protein HY900_22055, partial [Deltaproteobacteria bacterium]|nr:hypothetical protein [Deltaproteobacteria bacterium]
LIRAKAGAAGGEDWSPEVGDHVAVGFFEGQWKDPVVLGFIPAPGNMVEAKGEAAPRYYRAHQGTTETVEKTGRRVVHVAEDDVLEVVGNGTVTLGGNLTVTIQGNATITASGTVNVDGSVINLGGAGVHRLIDERLIDLYNNHRHGSSTVPSIALSLESVATSTTKAT